MSGLLGLVPVKEVIVTVLAAVLGVCIAGARTDTATPTTGDRWAATPSYDRWDSSRGYDRWDD